MTWALVSEWPVWWMAWWEGSNEKIGSILFSPASIE